MSRLVMFPGVPLSDLLTYAASGLVETGDSMESVM